MRAPRQAMGIQVKTPAEIQLMRKAGQVVHETLRRCGQVCKPGVTTAQINEQAENVLAETGGFGLFKNYPSYRPGEGFPAATCISVNDEVVHGIPGPRVIRDGDVVSIDFGVRLNGWCADAAVTVLVGEVPADVRRMCQVTRQVLELAIRNMKPGARWSQIARLMEQEAVKAGMGVVRDFVGHGIGRLLHEEPKVPNFVSRDLQRHDIDLRPGMVLAVEPMCCLGSEKVRILDDQWTVVTMDGKCAAHYEHTIAITESGCEILTDGQ